MRDWGSEKVVNISCFVFRLKSLSQNNKPYYNLKTKRDKENTFSLLPPQAVPLPRLREAGCEENFDRGNIMSLYYNRKLISNAKNLRKNMTKQERHLWYDYLSKYPVRFQRQKVIDNYITDFYCASAKLVIEIDGSQHYYPDEMEYDKRRTTVLEKYKLTVMRISNYELDNNFEGVCRAIDLKIKELMG